MKGKTKLNDVAFLLIARFDTLVRLENTLNIIGFLQQNFETNIHVWEYDYHNNGLAQKLLPSGVYYKFNLDHDPILHRTRYINEMVRAVSADFVSVWDVDVITPTNQIQKSIALLRSGADFVYPYDSMFLDTTELIRKMYLDSNDISLLERCKDYMISYYQPNPVGGAFFANRESYIKSGLENENFYGWGYEDGERYNRWNSMGFCIKKVPGVIYHLTHPRLINSMVNNPDQEIFKKRELLTSIKRAYEI